MHVGITATRVGASLIQRELLRFYLLKIRQRGGHKSWFHHGDCVGGDEQAHDIAEEAGFKIHVHPPNDTKLRAFKNGDRESPPMDYLIRNQDIVISSNVMFVLPSGFVEQKRSGTWATYRFTKRSGKPFVVIFPNGDIEYGNGAEKILRPYLDGSY